VTNYLPQWSFRRFACLALVVSSSALVACKCETACSSLTDSSPRNQAQNNNGAESGGNSDQGNGDSGAPDASAIALDCDQLDPNEVYMLGYLERGNRNLRALINVEHPERFCVGFPENSFALNVTDEGRLLYWQMIENSTFDPVYSMVEDELTLDNRDLWVYPSEPENNDELVAGYRSNSRFLPVATDEGTEYFSATPGFDFEVLRHGDEEPFYTRRADALADAYHLVAMLPDRSMILGHNRDGLVLVDSEFEETHIEAPMTASAFNYNVARQFVDPVTGNDSLWIIVDIHNSETDTTESHRWSLDLDALTVEHDGTFAQPPEHHSAGHPKVLDREGQLVQIGFEEHVEDFTFSVMRRPIASSGLGTEILHTDADRPRRSWTTEAVPFVEVSSSTLATGN